MFIDYLLGISHDVGHIVTMIMPPIYRLEAEGLMMGLPFTSNSKPGGFPMTWSMGAILKNYRAE
ncbi:MAG: hypothetical protein C7B47_03460 [Sulfobacillus thermosulfidooxidans]|uniref:Uncharacterized protein n=1 Tax=Sulfobacillus thermosulfidooxidans TaxID=28034 RepID=A0A2T2X3E8_SULTH|nr:MAG: hypothetical protein C7B47_03460 [Sulfobacillus thermosulfidooxidans]